MENLLIKIFSDIKGLCTSQEISILEGYQATVKPFGEPNGDIKMVVSLGRVDGKLIGTIAKSDLSDPKKFIS